MKIRLTQTSLEAGAKYGKKYHIVLKIIPDEPNYHIASNADFIHFIKGHSEIMTFSRSIANSLIGSKS